MSHATLLRHPPQCPWNCPVPLPAQEAKASLPLSARSRPLCVPSVGLGGGGGRGGSSPSFADVPGEGGGAARRRTGGGGAARSGEGRVAAAAAVVVVAVGALCRRWRLCADSPVLSERTQCRSVSDVVGCSAGDAEDSVKDYSRSSVRQTTCHSCLEAGE